MREVVGILEDDFAGIVGDRAKMYVPDYIEGIFEDKFYEEDLAHVIAHDGELLCKACKNDKPIFIYKSKINRSIKIWVNENERGAGYFCKVVGTFSGMPSSHQGATILM